MGNGLKDYSSFIKQIKDLIYRRQYEAMKTVNAELIQLYWEINEGTNLAPMVQEIRSKSLPPLVAEISWSKICVITEKYAPPSVTNAHVRLQDICLNPNDRKKSLTR